MKSPPTSKPRDRAKAAEATPAANDLFPVVAIGASAGGLEAYTELFRALPPDTGMAFVLIQHLDPSHVSMLPALIGKTTRMPVAEIKAGVKLRPNRVYVIPPNVLVAIADGAFVLTPRTKEPGQHLAVNFFMQALAQERKGQAIGIVLSGTGSDGALGVAAIRAEGGVNFAQDPASAKYDGMPRSAIASGSVDFVLLPKAIAEELDRINRHPYVAQAKDETASELDLSGKDDFRSILGLLGKISGADFSQYKPNTIHRRTLRRMMFLRQNSMHEYAKHLQEHREELEKLYDDILIPVTSFFRDFEAFEALKSQVYPAIVNNKGNEGTVRMWAPGCSTGEETYSLAMTLLEFLGDKAASFQIQLFGTDLNGKGIQKARAGVYRASIADEISPERMRRFFVKVEDGYRVNKAVRDMCVFAKQNLASDPPFSQMNLVACRNLLIYMQPVLQQRVVPILHYALKPAGFLVLGSSESVSAFPNLFSTVDKKHKIYVKKATASRLHYDFSRTHYPGESDVVAPPKELPPRNAAEREFDVQSEADRIVLENYGPVGVVVNSALEVVRFRGRTIPYLEPASGRPSLNVLKMARHGLAMELRTLIAAARKNGAPVKKDGVRFDGNGHQRTLNLSVSPLGEKSSPEELHFLVLFDDVTAQRAGGPADASPPRTRAGTEKKEETRRLHQELADAQAALRAAAESDDAAREEFHSANEEILSANEELQSTNEELETSKEELHSANEELTTLNEELRNKNDELHQLNNDLANFMNSTKIPVVILNNGLRIRRLTPTAGKLLKATASDIGRSISDIRLNVKVPDLEARITKVLGGLQPEHCEVQDMQDHWHSLAILPYRTLDKKIDGVVLALQDIDAIKSANELLRKSTDFFRGIIDTVREPLLVLDADLRIMGANESFHRTFKVPAEAVINKFLYRLDNAQWNIPALRILLEQVLPEKKTIKDYAIELDSRNSGRRKMLLNARTLVQASEQRPMILLAIEDITERKLVEVALIKSEKLAAAGRLAATLAHEINNPLQAVMNLMTLLEQSPKVDKQDQEYAALAARELGSVVHLIRQSLGFYREVTLPTDVNLCETMESVLALYARQIEAKEITVTKQYLSEGTIKGYPGEMRQVFSTLLINAMEAVSTGGAICIRVSQSFDWKDPAKHGLRVSVADNGNGIAAANTRQVFEPFFTTKGEMGTGLGLWVAQGMVSRLGGSIRLHSGVRPEKSGTCLSIFLAQTPK